MKKATYSAKLAFTNTIAIHNDPIGLESRCFVEQNQQFPVK